MNSFRPIPIHSEDRSASSRSSLDMGNQSWKLEKMLDNRGKSNYKLITSGTSRAVVDGRGGGGGGAASTRERERRNRSRKQQQQATAPLKSIGAYGVPGANAYLNTKAPTLNSSVMRTMIKKVKNAETKAIQDVSDVSSKTLRNDTERVLEGYAEIHGKVSRNMMIGNNGKFVSYNMEGNDFLQKSFANGHLVSSNIHLYNMHLLLSYFGTAPIGYCTVSLWSQIFSPALELVNLVTVPIQDIVSTKGRFLSKEIVMDTVPPGQIFVTVNFPDEIEGFFSLKYSIEGTQIYDHLRERDVPFEFPDFFLNQNNTENVIQAMNNHNPLRAFAALHNKVSLPPLAPELTPAPVAVPTTPAPIPVAAPTAPAPAPAPAPVAVAPAPPTPTTNYASALTLPTLSKNIFGNYIRGKTGDNIPIFGNPIVEKPGKGASSIRDEDHESSNFFHQSTHMAKKMSLETSVANGEEDADFTEKDDTDIKNILSILRNQNSAPIR
uniref:Uncharacterized protein n=1 Tax=viral metagenome TaxID=1070528 RepID=A0A6C0K499_9ZZZZ